MYRAVSSFMMEAAFELSTELQEKGNLLLAGLNDLMLDRSDMMMQHQRECKTLPKTGIYLVDALLDYLLMKTESKQIELDVAVEEPLLPLVQNSISQGKLETLIADLVENAIIATSKCENRRILVTFGKVENCFQVSVSDSGVPFEIGMLRRLGLEKSTTHADEGGSGIGYMMIFEIAREVKASIIISEKAPGSPAYTKTAAIRFDGKLDYIIESFRAEDIRLFGNRPDMQVRPTQ